MSSSEHPFTRREVWAQAVWFIAGAAVTAAGLLGVQTGCHRPAAPSDSVVTHCPQACPGEQRHPSATFARPEESWKLPPLLT